MRRKSITTEKQDIEEKVQVKKVRGKGRVKKKRTIQYGKFSAEKRESMTGDDIQALQDRFKRRATTSTLRILGVMGYLDPKIGSYVSDLSSRAMTTYGNTQIIVNELEKLGILETHVDGRMRVIRVTSQGRGLCEEVWKVTRMIGHWTV